MSSLSFQNISIQAGEREVVHEVSCELQGGVITVLLGANGSGKSSFINGVMGHPHFTRTQGTILLEGEDISSCTTQEKAQKGLFLSLQHTPTIGGVTLTTFLSRVESAFCGQEKPILEYYLSLRERVTAFGIREDLLERPLAEGLSGGERKLSESIQLLALKPKFALLDELDSGVDVDALKKVCAVIATLKKEGTGFLVVSHNPTLLSFLVPDVVLVMQEGRIVKRGSQELVDEIGKNGFA